MNVSDSSVQQGLLSGIYVRRAPFFTKTGFRPGILDVVRFDVDGTYPQKTASGTYYPNGAFPSILGPVHWVAYPLYYEGSGNWSAPILSTWGNKTRLPHTNVTLHVLGGAFQVAARKMTLTFSGGAPSITLNFEYESPYFRTAEIEFDTVQDATKVTQLNTTIHPVRPASLKQEHLTVQKIYDYAGVDLRTTTQPSTSSIPITAAGADTRWTDQEVNDAMHKYWSRYRASSQWAMWMLFAGLPQGSDTLAGRMFDDGRFDDVQRQGLVIFNDVWDNPKLLSAGYSGRANHVTRLRFFAAIHESGHCFNLAHSFEKRPDSWLPILAENEPDAYSFMNYPHKVDGSDGNEGFFRNFFYRFSDQDLQFIRHAPENFIEMGDSDFFTNHGFEPATATHPGPWTLTARLNRERPVFEFLEPVYLELTLTNTGNTPALIEEGFLEDSHHLAIYIEDHTGRIQTFRPFTRSCYIPIPHCMQPGASITSTRFISAGPRGWGIAEPGSYKIHAHLVAHNFALAATPATFRVAHPQSFEEELLAQDLLTPDVGRAIAFGGTRSMTAALAALEQASSHLSKRAIGLHASLALGLPLLQPTKQLYVPEGESPMAALAEDGGSIQMAQANPDEAKHHLDAALFSNKDQSIATFGKRNYQTQLDRYHSCLYPTGK